MLAANEIKSIERKIHSHFEMIENTYYHEYVAYQRKDDVEEYPGYTKFWMERKIKDLYYLIQVYLEANELPYYLQQFIYQFQDQFKNEKTNLLKAENFDPESDEGALVIIDHFKQFLLPFKTPDRVSEKEDEFQKLLSILKHTDYVLKNSSCLPSREEDIYNQIKWVLGLYYPKTRRANKAGFIQQFKTYKPDILIPELKTVIEYKYIKHEAANIEDYIDQVRVDAVNYTGDDRFDRFVAVLYIIHSKKATDENIHAAWQQKRFPDNWELVIARG